MGNNITKKIASVVISATTVIWLSGSAMLLPVAAQAQSISDLLAQITALQAQLVALQGGAAAAPASYNYTRNLTVGSRGDDVTAMQSALKAGGFLAVEPTGYFGNLTKAALVKWQAANGVSPAAGYFGAITRAKIASLASAGTSTTGGSTGTTGGTVVVAPAGSGLAVALASNQPVSSLAPASAARIPFTVVTLTAGNADVAVSSLVIERTGLASDSALSGVVLLDENGNQMGIVRTLNSDHRATIGEALTVKAGQTRTLTIAGNRADAGSLGGQTISLSVVLVNTSGTVSATFPMVGTTHTVNETLTIGSATSPSRGSLDPGSSQTKEVGTTNYTFSSVKWTAGSAEKMYVKSIRWNQTGSAGISDLANVKTYVDGVSYDAAVSADGKYYTTLFPGKGLLVDKGFSKELSVKGDIVGGSGRTVDFDVAKRADVYIVGDTFGYGITPTLASSAAAADGAAFNNTDDYYYDAAQVLVSAGTMNVSAWTGVQAQNIAVNLANQSLAGFSVDVKGEPVTVGKMIFQVTNGIANANVSMADLTNVSLVNAAGATVAGPIDGAGTANDGTITFTDSVTFPIGITNLKLVGKLSTDYATNDTVAASSTPSTQWTTVTGSVTGNTVTPAPTSAVTGQTMTVKTGSLSITVSTQPTARTVIAGASAFEFARYILDGTGSGEDVRLTSLLLAYGSTGTATNATNCQLYDGTDANSPSLTTGSNVKNPTAVSSSTTMTFDGTGYILPKGTAKTLSLRCNLASGSTGNYFWGIDDAATYTGATGMTSGQTIAETVTDANGQDMTAATAGTYTVALDSSVLYKLAEANTSGVTLGGLKFTAGAAENVVLKQIALQLNSVASNSPADLVGQKVYIYNGATLVGTAQFGVGVSADTATSTLSSPVTIPKNETVALTLKGDLSVQNASEGTPGAYLVVDYDGNNVGTNGNFATGADSGSTISSDTTTDSASNGLRIMRSVPTLADVTTTTALAGGTSLYAVKVTAGAGRDIGIYKMSFKISTTGATVTSFQLFADLGGAVNATAVDATRKFISASGVDVVEIVFDNNAVGRTINAGTSKIYRLQANTLSGVTSQNVESLNIQLVADAGSPTTSATNLLTRATIFPAGGTTLNSQDNFIWTPFSTTTPTLASTADSNQDFMNGYGLPGFPGLGQSMQTRVFSD